MIKTPRFDNQAKLKSIKGPGGLAGRRAPRTLIVQLYHEISRLRLSERCFGRVLCAALVGGVHGAELVSTGIQDRKAACRGLSVGHVKNPAKNLTGNSQMLRAA